MKKLFFIALFLFFISINLNATGTNKNDSIINLYFNNLYNFSFYSAEKNLNEIKKSNISTNYKYLCEINFFWWKIITGDNQNDFYYLCNNDIDLLIKNLEKDNKVSVDYFYNFMIAYAFKSRLLIMQDKLIKSISYINKTLSTVDLFINFYNTDEKLKFLAGLYFYFSDYGKEKYPLLGSYLSIFPKGNKILGINLLVDGSNSNNLLIKVESIYFLTKIYLDIENDYSKAYYFCGKLISMYPNNIVYQFIYYKILQKLGLSEFATRQYNFILYQISNNTGLNECQKKHFLLQMKQK